MGCWRVAGDGSGAGADAKQRAKENKDREVGRKTAQNFTVFIFLRALFGIGMGGEWGVGASLAMEAAPVPMPNSARKKIKTVKLGEKPHKTSRSLFSCARCLASAWAANGVLARRWRWKRRRCRCQTARARK